MHAMHSAIPQPVHQTRKWFTKCRLQDELAQWDELEVGLEKSFAPPDALEPAVEEILDAEEKAILAEVVQEDRISRGIDESSEWIHASAPLLVLPTQTTVLTNSCSDWCRLKNSSGLCDPLGSFRSTRVTLLSVSFIRSLLDTLHTKNKGLWHHPQQVTPALTPWPYFEPWGRHAAAALAF